MTYTMKDEMMITPPGSDQVGSTRSWELPGDTVDGTGVSELTFTGQYIGFGSSQRDSHINHDGEKYAPKGITCSACRWFEARIFVRASDDKYLVFTVGQSVVDGEQPRHGYEWLTSPYEVIDKLTTLRRDPDTGFESPTLSWAARRVLAQAAFYDEDLEVAYNKRISTL